jgi:hypothetical protein
MDAVYVGIGVASFVAAWAAVWALGRLLGGM